MRPSTLKQVAAFAVIYFVWGSNFLAIRFAVEAIPPFLTMGVRSLIAGALLYAWARLRGAEKPGFHHWRSATLVGALLFLGCHGALAWAEQRVPSGVASLVLATIPLWMTLLDWLSGGARPVPAVWAGMALGGVGGSAFWSGSTARSRPLRSICWEGPSSSGARCPGRPAPLPPGGSGFPHRSFSAAEWSSWLAA